MCRLCVCVLSVCTSSFAKSFQRQAHAQVTWQFRPLCDQLLPWAPPLLAGAQGPPAAALVNFFLFFLFFKNPKMPNFPLGAALVGGRAGAPSRCLCEFFSFFLFFCFSKTQKCPTFPCAPPLLAGAQGPPAAALVKKKIFFPQTPRDAQLSLGRRR